MCYGCCVAPPSSNAAPYDGYFSIPPMHIRRLPCQRRTKGGAAPRQFGNSSSLSSLWRTRARGLFQGPRSHPVAPQNCRRQWTRESSSSQGEPPCKELHWQDWFGNWGVLLSRFCLARRFRLLGNPPPPLAGVHHPALASKSSDWSLHDPSLT